MEQRIGVYASWVNNHPVCPKCNGSDFYVSYNEEILYNVKCIKNDLLIGDHRHIDRCEPYLEWIGCCNCDVDIVITQAVRNYFEED